MSSVFIMLDEPASLLSHVGEGAMNKNEVEIWALFLEIIKNCNKLGLTYGDVAQLDSKFLQATMGACYTSTIRTIETKETMNIIKDNAKCEAGLLNASHTFKREGPNYIIRIISQRSKQFMSLQDDLTIKFPDQK